jgi:hypothetical protein
MGKSKMMGAGNASATLYKSNPNLNTFGGNKKQGITSRVGLDNWENREVQTKSNGIGRFKLVCMNQLGGVGPGHSMFGGRWNRADGMKSCKTVTALNGVDFSGYDTITVEYPGTGSTINTDPVNGKIFITNAVNLESITTIYINSDDGSIILPVQYEGGNEFSILLTQDIQDYITAANPIQFPVSVSIGPSNYVKKSSVATSNNPLNTNIFNAAPLPFFNIRHEAFIANAPSIECPDILTIPNGTATGKLFLISTFGGGTAYIYYTDPNTFTTTFFTQYNVTCV